ncbi:MAG: TolC family protein [Planctomycetota bacterium]
MLPILPPTAGVRYKSVLVLAALLWLPALSAGEAQPPGRQGQFVNPDAPVLDDGTAPAPVNASTAGPESAAVPVAEPAAAADQAKAAKPANGGAASGGSGYYLSLDEAVELAIQKNLNLLEARLNDRLSDIGVREAWAQYYPGFSSNLTQLGSSKNGALTQSVIQSADTTIPATTTSSLGPFNTPVNGGLTNIGGSVTQRSPWGTVLGFSLSDAIAKNSAYNSGPASVSLRQPLWKGRGTDVGLAEIRTARINRLISRGSLDLAVQQVIFSVRSAYAAVIRAIQNREVSTQAVNSAKAFLVLTEVRKNAGQVTQLDVFNAEVQVRSRELDLITDETALETAFDNLKRLLDVDLAEQLRVDAPLVDFGEKTAPGETKAIISDEAAGTVYLKVTRNGQPVGEPAVLAQATHFDDSVVLQEALNNRLDLLNARRTLAIQKVQGLLAKDGLGHQIDLVGGFGRDANGRSVLEADNGKEVNFWSAGVQATFPWGKIKDRAAYERALLAVEKAELDLKLARTAVEADVRLSVRSLRQDEKGLLIGGQLVEQAKLAVAAVKVSFVSGLKDSFAVIQAEDALLAAKRDFIGRQLDYVVQLALFETIVGKPTGRVEMSGQTVGGLVDSKLPEGLKGRGLPKPAPEAEPRPEDDPLSRIPAYRKDYKAQSDPAIIIKE